MLAFSNLVYMMLTQIRRASKQIGKTTVEQADSDL